MRAQTLLASPSAYKEAVAQFKHLLGRIPSTPETQVAKYLGCGVKYRAARVGADTSVYSGCSSGAGSVTSAARAGAAAWQ